MKFVFFLKTNISVTVLFHTPKSLFLLIWFVILTCFCLVRYEQQLSDSLEREKNLEIMRTQIELEWQRCCENMKTEHYSVNEQLMKGQNENQVSVCVSVFVCGVYILLYMIKITLIAFILLIKLLMMKTIMVLGPC